MSLREVVIELYCLKIALHCVGETSSTVVANSEEVIETSVVQPQFHRFGQVFCRFGIVLLLIIQQPQVAAQGSEITLNRNSFLVIGNGSLLIGFGFDEA